ncbi:MAG: gliding motility-associated C-terminal domain-containing protein, partial [Pricia sp.]
MKARLLTYAPVLFIAYFLLGAAQVSAQTVALNAPKSAGNPNNGDSPTEGVWDKICAGNNNGFNQYFATVSWAGTPNADNEWILELSNASGSFTDATELARESSNATVQNPGFEFSVPTDTRGAGYKMRVRGTSPATTGPATSASYSMYYMDVTTPLAISKDGDGVITSNVCSNSSSVRLEVHNITNPETYQYNWYRSG